MYNQNENLAVLAFALRVEGVSEQSYEIRLPVDRPIRNETLVLEIEEESWKVFFFERGARRRISVFESGYDAASFFYWTLTNKEDYRAYRLQWEAADRR